MAPGTNGVGASEPQPQTARGSGPAGPVGGLAGLDPGPDAVVGREEDRLHQRLDRADGQGQAPVLGQGQCHANRDRDVHQAIGDGLQRNGLERAGQGVAVVGVGGDALLLVSVHDVDAGGDGFGRFLDFGQLSATLDAVPDSVVDRVGEGLENRLDHADGQGEAPVAGDRKRHQNGDHQVYDAVAGDLERKAADGLNDDLNHNVYVRMVLISSRGFRPISQL